MDDHRPRNQFDRPALMLLAGFCIALFAGAELSGVRYARLEAAENDDEGSGELLVLGGEANRGFQGNLKRALDELQQRAQENGRDTYLVLELHKGPSTLGQISDVADLLMSPEYPRVRTVAWIPADERLTGYNAVIALACHRIVMHSDAAIGDITEGREADERVRTLVQTIVKSRRNPRLQEAIALGMLSDQTVVLKVSVRFTRDGRKVSETRFVTQKGLDELRKDNTVEIPDQAVTIKEAGAPGIFSGSKASDDNFLIDRTATDVDDLQSYLRIQLDRAAVHDKPALIKVEGELNQVLESFLIRQIDRCVDSGKNLIIFEITSPGGPIKPAIALSQRIAELDDRILTVAYVPSQATSSAALIALACKELYMAPKASIGEALPTEIKEEHRGPLREHLKELAKRTNRPAALLLAMADKNVVVYRVTHPKDGRETFMTDEEIKADREAWKKGPPVPESQKGELLTVNGRRAVELKLARDTLQGKDRARQLKDLIARLHLPEDTRLSALQPTWVDTLVFWLNNDYVTVFLLVAAIVCIYLETHLMSGILGLISVLCFALFFWARFLGGTAGWLEIILFVLGLGCLVIEIFVIPGFGVFGVTGGLLIIASLVLASQTFGNFEPNADYRMLAGTMAQLAVSIVLVVALAVALSRYLPNVPLFGQMVLTPPGHTNDASAAGPKLRPDVLDERAALVGTTGEAVSVLRPSGKAEIGGRMYDVVSEGPYIAAGSPITVVSVSGNRIVVREA